MAETVFECKKCGQCCSGRGGILLAEHDLARLAVFLRTDAGNVIRKYAESAGDKLRVRQGGDGFCIFFRSGQGCMVHAAKPDVCRAWPFFRGNLVDRESFIMAKEWCPGIRNDAEFDDFARRGLEFLVREKLAAPDIAGAPNALKVQSLLGDS